MLFLGPSGMGKSTLSRNGRRYGHRILSDDTVFVERMGDAFHASGTPFGRITDGPITARVDGLFFLEQAPYNAVTVMKSSEAAVRMWEDSLYNHRYFSRETRQEAFLGNLQLVRSSKCFLLEFRKDFRAWDLLGNAASD